MWHLSVIYNRAQLSMMSMTMMMLVMMSMMMTMRGWRVVCVGECKPQVEPQLNTNMTNDNHHHHHHHHHEDPLGMIREDKGPRLRGHPGLACSTERPKEGGELGGSFLSLMASFCSQDPTNPPHYLLLLQYAALFSPAWDQIFSIMHLFHPFLQQVLMPKKVK